VDRELLLAVSQATADGDSLGLLQVVERLSDHGADYRNFTRELLLHFRELLVLKLAPAESALVSAILPDERERLRERVSAFSEEDLLRALDVLGEADTELRLAADPRVTLELALLKIVQLRKLLPFAELVDRVERLASGAASAPRAAVPAARPPAPEPARAARGPARPSASTAVSPGAPAAIPAPAAPTAASTPPSDADVLLATMIGHAQTRPSLGQSLRGATARFEGDVLVLEVAAAFAPFAAMHGDEYQQLARQAAGRAVKVRVATGAGDETPAPAPPSPREQARERMMKEAGREPAVQEALDLFGGRVVDVREAKP
jgi:DNA polymerase-3 subunit gamma/tau